jgi:hypothetical protein
MVLLLSSSAFGAGLRIKTSGKLIAPAKDVPILVVSTDPILQRVLSEDIAAAGRTTITLAKRAVTLTVTSTERLLTPGLAVQQLAPGDPEVGRLLAEVGIDAPALGVGGSDSADTTAAAAPSSPAVPLDPQQQQAARYQQSFMPMLGGFGMPGTNNSGTGMPGMGGSTTGNSSAAGGLAGLFGQHNGESQIYDTAMVVIAALDQGGKLTVLAIVPPNQNISAAKETIAEKIANAVLR